MFVARFLGDVNRIGSVNIRPENLRITREQPPSDGPCQRAVVEACTFLGSHVRFQLRLPSGESCLADSAVTGDLAQPSDTVFITWQRRDQMELVI